MITTSNYMQPADENKPSPAERMAKARAAKVAKAKARGVPTTGGHPPAVQEATSGVRPQNPQPPKTILRDTRNEVAQSPGETRAILLELQAMYMRGSKPYELVAKALRLLEARGGGGMPGGEG